MMARTGRPEKYLYDRLFDGRPRKLLGADVQLVQTIRLAARRRGLTIEQRKIPGGYEVTVHAGNGTRAPGRPARPVRMNVTTGRTDGQELRQREQHGQRERARRQRLD